MVSEVLSGRVSQALKQALTTRAGERGLSLNATLVELLERGLAVSEQEGAGDEREAARAASASELEQTRARLAAAEGRLAAAAAQEERTQSTLRALAERARGVRPLRDVGGVRPHDLTCVPRSPMVTGKPAVRLDVSDRPQWAPVQKAPFASLGSRSEIGRAHV